MGFMDLFKKKEVKEVKKINVEFVGNTPVEKLQNLIISNPNIALKKDEVCFYKGDAKSYHKKNVVTGYSGGGAGVSLRVTKGVSLHTGSSAKKAIRNDVIETYPAEFFVTNRRVILLSSKYGFTLDISKILQIKLFSNGIEFFSESKSYMVLTSDSEYINQIFSLMNEGYERQ